MSSPPAQPAQPHLVTLVLQSKKALQHGEQLCSRAHAISNASARTAVDVVALDAKVRWVTEAVGEQLKMVASVAKSIEEKRAYLEQQVQAWDTLRAKHSDALDNILESLGSQSVPPDFHESNSSDSSLFGSQHSDKVDERDGDEARSEAKGSPLSVNRSLSSTLRNGLVGRKPTARERERMSRQADRTLWKTLRDFVDEQAIEDVLETIENDRLGLDNIVSKTDDYPETLVKTISSIRHSLPKLSTPPAEFVEEILAAQDKRSTSMAAHLESLASHYDQMASALREGEAGEEFSDEDIHDMNRDTNELPSIMAEMEEAADTIEMHHEKLQATQEMSKDQLSLLKHILDDLDELGDIMTEMLQTQENIEAQCEEELNGLHGHLLAVEHLHDRYVSYQMAFSKLILELARRRQYREAAENIVRGMMAQLEAMTNEENQVRSHFNSEYGAHLPEDICVCIGNAPTKWEVVPWSGDVLEFLPTIEDDLIVQARERINANSDHEGVSAIVALGTESL